MPLGHTNVTANQKGGVGKSTYVFNLAKGLANRNFRVLAIDNDPQGDLTQSLLGEDALPEAHTLSLYENNSVEPQPIEENLNLIGASIELAVAQEKPFDIIFDFTDQVAKYKATYDFILIDSLPSFGIMHTAALMTADSVTIPTKAAPYSLKAVKMLHSTIDRIRRPRMNPNLKVLGIVLNYVEGSQTSLGREIEKRIREHYKSLVFRNRIPRTVRLEESPAFKESIMEYEPGSKAAEAFERIIDEFLEKFEAIYGEVQNEQKV